MEIMKYDSEAACIENGGYPGWKPEYGTQCRGPLPPTSNLTKVNNIARVAYEKNGLDMRWYADMGVCQPVLVSDERLVP